MKKNIYSSHQALLIIDYTNDFVADKGSLTCGKPAQKLEPSIVDLANKFYQNGDWVILPTDVHIKDNPYHPETYLFPTHNVRGTWGRQLYGKLNDWYQAQKKNPKVFQMDKTRYSAFIGTNLDLMLRERHINTLHLVGVCTDICVLHTAIGAYNRNYNIVVHKSGVATLNDTAQKWALNHFKNCLGAKVVK